MPSKIGRFHQHWVKLSWNNAIWRPCGPFFNLFYYVHIFVKKNPELVSNVFWMNVERKEKIFCGKKRIFYQFKIFSPKFSYCVAHQACRSDYAPTLRPCVQRSWIYIFLHININSYLIIFYVLLANNISVKTKKILKHYFRLIHFTKQIFLNYAKNEIATKHCKLCRGFVCGDVLSV